MFWLGMNCQFARIISLRQITDGRECAIDKCICFHWDNEEVYKDCPTLKETTRQEVIG